MGEQIEICALDPSIPFEAVLIKMAETHRIKSQAYGSDGDSMQSFKDGAYNTGLSPLVVCEVLLGKHHSALKQWQIGKKGHNLTSDDAYLDRAVYAVLAKVLYDAEVDI